jgi:hypothetical protein
MRTRFIALHYVVLVVLIGFSAATPLQADVLPVEPDVFSRDSVIYGRSYGDWSAAWQQWADSIPADQHPLFDNADCSRGQSGNVWFLGGKFCSIDDPECPNEPAERSCTVPAGTALYFPVVNFGCLNIEAENGLCGEGVGAFITQMRSAIGKDIDQTTNLQVTVDEKQIKNDRLKGDFRVQSSVFTAKLPNGNLLQAIGYEQITAGTYWGVDDGVYVMLKALSPGDHTINFKGRFPQYNFDLDFTYHLNVLAN